MIIKVKEPLPSEYPCLRPGLIVFTYLHLAADQALTYALLERGVTGIAYETVEGSQRDLPLLEPMSEVAGAHGSADRLALSGAAGRRARHLDGGVPGVAPAHVVILGAGSVGANAAKIALGMGARVSLLDINLERLRPAEDALGGKLTTLYSNSINISRAIRSADALIGAVLITGARAPMLVTRDMLPTMPRRSVIVDVAVDQGRLRRNHAPEPPTATQLMSSTASCIMAWPICPAPCRAPPAWRWPMPPCPTPLKIANLGAVAALEQDVALRRGLNTFAGLCAHPAIADTFGLDYVPPELALDEAGFVEFAAGLIAPASIYPVSPDLARICYLFAAYADFHLSLQLDEPRPAAPGIPAGMLISAVFLALAFRGLQPEHFLSSLSQVNLPLLLVAALVYFMAVVAIAWRWQFLLRGLQLIALSSLAQIVCIGYMGNNLYPPARRRRPGASPCCAASMPCPPCASPPWSSSNASSDGCVMLAFILFSLLFIDLQSETVASIVALTTPLFAAALCIAFVLAAKPKLLRRPRFCSRSPPATPPGTARKPLQRRCHRRAGEPCAARFISSARSSPPSSPGASKPGIYWLVMFAFGLELDYALALLLVGAVNLAGLIRPRPGRSASTSSSSSPFSQPWACLAAATATAYAVVTHLVIWLPPTLLGFLLLLRQGLGWSDIGKARAGGGLDRNGSVKMLDQGRQLRPERFGDLQLSRRQTGARFVGRASAGYGGRHLRMPRGPLQRHRQHRRIIARAKLLDARDPGPGRLG